MSRSAYLNIASIIDSVSTLGPGRRFAIWVQGCPFSCKGCISADYIPFVKNQFIEIQTLANKIIASDVDGITISGGEPFAQAGQLAKLLQIVLEQRPELNVLVFTGFSFSKLTGAGARALLGYVDLLITELFVEDLNTEIGLRGSDNQEFHYLTNKFLKYKDQIEKSPKRIETIVDGNMITHVGIMSNVERKYGEDIIEILNNI
jgi:anaerobic ribonucleoside-triphosphate reductase activating protein